MANVEIIINAKDNASAPLGKVRQAMGGLGDAAKKIAVVGLAAAGAGIVAIGTGLGIAIKEAMEAQEVFAQTEAVIKSTGGVAGITAQAASDLAGSLSEVTRFGDEAILSGENLLLTFTNIGKDVFPDATEVMLDMSQALGQDLKASATQLGKALQDPIQGVTALSRVGVNFTEEQKKMIAEMVKSGDLMGAQTLILNELKTEFGGSARAAGQTFAGQLDILRNSLLNVAEDIGMELLPILQKLVGWATEKVVPAIKSIAEIARFLITGDFRGGIFDLFEDDDRLLALFTFRDTLSSIYEAVRLLITGDFRGGIFGLYEDDESIGALFTLRETIIDLADKVGTFVREHAEELKGALIAIGAVLAGAAIVSGILGIAGAIAALATPIGWIVLAVGVLGAAWAGNWGGIQDKTNAVINWIKPFIQAFLNAIKGFWDAHGAQIMATVKAIWDGIQTAIKTVIAVIKTIIETALKAIKAFWDAHGEAILAAAQTIWNNIQTAIETVLGIIQSVFAAFKSAFEGDWEGFGENLRKAWDAALGLIVTAAAATWGALKAALKVLVDNAIKFFTETDWLQVGKNIIIGIANGITAGIEWIKKAAQNAAKAAADAAKGFLGIKSPSKVFMEIGKNTMQGLAVGIGRGAGMPAAAAVGAANSIVNNFNMTVNTNAPASTVINDFGLMQSWARS